MGERYTRKRLLFDGSDIEKLLLKIWLKWSALRYARLWFKTGHDVGQRNRAVRVRARDDHLEVVKEDGDRCATLGGAP